MSPLWVIAIIVAVAIVAGLAFYAGKLLFQLKVQKEQQQAQLEKLKAKALERNAKIADSINLIARAMKEKQCEYSEGCLRIWVLMSQYQFAEKVDPETEYEHVFKMYEVVKEMPTHDARKKYSKKEIFQMDSKRWRAEQELEEGILAEAAKLEAYFPADPKTKHVFAS
ncbi:DUF2489 domain-containing protein [Pseudoalteromonas sp. SSM20]|uniref:DUF2489 domain-containing protein n=1 Tax=Pseudoalteromonas sp. SSM20 TaxID=3139394 RepID=UPI003BABD6E5